MKSENILIAEFDGRTFKGWNDNAHYNTEFSTFQECKDWLNELGNETHQPAIGWGDFGQHYETNWNLLMGVVEKIEAMGFLVEIYGTTCTISTINYGDYEMDHIDLKFWNDYNTTTIPDDSKKVAVYKSVVEFLTEYKKFRDEY